MQANQSTRHLIYKAQGEQACNEMVGRTRGELPGIRAYMCIIFVNGRNASLLLNAFKIFIPHTSQ